MSGYILNQVKLTCRIKYQVLYHITCYRLHIRVESSGKCYIVLYYVVFSVIVKSQASEVEQD